MEPSRLVPVQPIDEVRGGLLLAYEGSLPRALAKDRARGLWALMAVGLLGSLGCGGAADAAGDGSAGDGSAGEVAAGREGSATTVIATPSSPDAATPSGLDAARSTGPTGLPSAAAPSAAAPSAAATRLPPADPSAPRAGALRIHVLPLNGAGGGGDAILVADSTLAPPRHALIDAGEPGVARRIVELGVDTLDLMVLTHAHHDHYGGMPDVLDATHVRAFAFNGQARSAVTYRRMLERVLDEVPTVMAVDSVRTVRFGAGAGGTRLILLPPLPLHVATDTDESRILNDGSLAVRIERGAFSFLTTGDAEAEANERFHRAFPDHVDVDVLKLGHHGSRDATQRFWLDATTPEVAIVSANGTTHPHASVLRLVRSRGIELYCTAQHGRLSVAVDGAGGYAVTTEEDPSRACRPGSR